MTETRLLSPAVRQLCGGVSEMQIWRWTHEGAADFPKPVYIGRRRFWREADVVAWLNSRVSAPKPARPSRQAATEISATA
jgi:predicted DNA-binding transcriptional regulator AlpA